MEATPPMCAQHGQMAVQPAGTPEQVFCGVWYRCARCTNTVLLESQQLRDHLQSQQRGQISLPGISTSPS